MTDQTSMLEALSSQLGAGGIDQIASQLGLGRSETENAVAGALPMLLGGERQAAEKKAPGAVDLIGSLLDSDGDGSVTDDLAKLGGGLLGGLFGGK